jgi:predicted enzyme related to lactoylglutathione lyase
MPRFFHVQLRTRDVGAARAFYADLLGAERASALDIVPLPEQAIARGAPPHWLGHLDVDDLDGAVAAFEARGAMVLGPRRANGEAVILRDPGGAIVALAKRPPSVPVHGAATWQVLNTPDVERAKTVYRELFGWEYEAPEDRGTLGVFHPFAWEPGGPPVGAMSDIGPRHGVHPHWLFVFAVTELDALLETVRRSEGVVVGPFSLPGGARLLVCDDPQGAAFALLATSTLR